MADFNLAYNRMKVWEGGYQANPNDPGNYNSLGQLVGTNMGISAATLEKWLGVPPSAEDMKNLKPETAKAIYKEKFWNRIYGDLIPWQPVADILFDGVVQHGRGVQLAQEVLGVVPDNIWGPITYAALLAMHPANFYLDYRERRRKYYESLVDANPSLSVFLPGWEARLNSFDDYKEKGGISPVILVIITALLSTVNFGR